MTSIAGNMFRLGDKHDSEHRQIVISINEMFEMTMMKSPALMVNQLMKFESLVLLLLLLIFSARR